MKIECVWEHNGADSLLYAQNFPGAYARGACQKVLRRFIWHDRIHGKAMYRMACRTFAGTPTPNVFRFGF